MIAVEASGSEYLVAWEHTNGKRSFRPIPVAPEPLPPVLTAAQIRSMKTLFSTDLDGDGNVIATTTIESNGSTTLLTDGVVYYMTDALPVAVTEWLVPQAILAGR